MSCAHEWRYYDRAHSDSPYSGLYFTKVCRLCEKEVRRTRARMMSYSAVPIWEDEINLQMKWIDALTCCTKVRELQFTEELDAMGLAKKFEWLCPLNINPGSMTKDFKEKWKFDRKRSKQEKTR